MESQAAIRKNRKVIVAMENAYARLQARQAEADAEGGVVRVDDRVVVVAVVVTEPNRRVAGLVLPLEDVQRRCARQSRAEPSRGASGGISKAREGGGDISAERERVRQNGEKET